MRTEDKWQLPAVPVDNFVYQRLQILPGRSLEDLSITGGALVESETQFGGNQRLNTIEEQIVEFRAGLAADFDGIFETCRGNQSHARAFALQKSVRTDCSAVQQNHRIASANFFQRFDDCLGWVGRSRENFEHLSVCRALARRSL